jgi:hypothetical protein
MEGSASDTLQPHIWSAAGLSPRAAVARHRRTDQAPATTLYSLRVAEQTSPAAYAARHVGHKDSGSFRLLATQRPPLDLDKMCVLIEVALHFGAKLPNLGMRPIVRNVIIVA